MLRSVLKNRKGQTINVATGTIMALVMLIFIVFAVFFGIATLNPSSFFTANSAEANATSQLQGNLTTGVAIFGGYFPTIMKVLAVVVILGALVLLILYVARMKGASGTAGGGASL